MFFGRGGNCFVNRKVSRNTHELLREEAQELDRSGSYVSNFFTASYKDNIKSVLIIIILSRSNKSFHEESLIEEAWDGSVITTKEEKETYPMLSVHLCGGQFKREFISVFFTKSGRIRLTLNFPFKPFAIFVIKRIFF